MSPLTARWTQIVSNARLCRSSQTISIVDSKAYIFGGELLPRQPVDDQVDIVDLQDKKHLQVQTPVSPSPRVGSATVVVNNDIWLFSGRGGPEMNAIDEVGEFWRFDTASSTWHTVCVRSSIIPSPRSYHAMAFDGSRTIYLHAGCPAHDRLSDLWSFDIDECTWTELPSAPGPPRGGTSIAFTGGKLFRMGGFDGKSEQGGCVDVYDAANKHWSSITFPPDGVQGPSPRSVASLLAMKTPTGDSVLVTLFGECDPSALGHAGAGKMLGDVWAFDVKNSSWDKVASKGSVPPSRGWFSAGTTNDGQAAIVHGGLAEDNSRLGDVWMMVWLC